MSRAVDARGVLEPAYWGGTGPLRPRRQEAVFGHIVSGIDAVVLLTSFGLAYVLRNRIGYGTLQPFPEYVWVALMFVPIWLVLARAMSLATSPIYRWPARAVINTLKVHFIASLIPLSVLYLLKAVEVSRLLVQTFVVVSGVALTIERVVIHAALVRLAPRWKTETRRLLVLGPAAVAEGLQRLLARRPHWGASVVGLVADGQLAQGSGEVPVLGSVADLEMLLDTHVFDEVVMADAATEREHGERVVAACLERGLTYHTLVRMPGHQVARHHAETLGDGVYFLSLVATPQNPIALFIKRAMDIVGACAGLLLCGVAYAVFAPIIRLGSAGPVVFRQIRVGRNGRRFTLYKFRTMGSDAEAEKGSLLASNDMSGHLFKMREDPRVTPIGRFLRRTYIDELPQFWNVLRGEMSLVGTRPPMPEEVACYSPGHRRRLSVRPGITGLWQCQGNGLVSDFETVVRLDCEYIDRWTILLDLEILTRTCLVVARRAGR